MERLDEYSQKKTVQNDISEQEIHEERLGRRSLGYIKLGTLSRMMGAEAAKPILDAIAEQERINAEAVRRVFRR